MSSSASLSLNTPAIPSRAESSTFTATADGSGGPSSRSASSMVATWSLAALPRMCAWSILAAESASEPDGAPSSLGAILFCTNGVWLSCIIC